MPRYKKGATARDIDLFGPKLPLFTITPQLVHATAISDKTLREEYTRLRDIAQKRIKRMQGKPEAAGTLANLPEGGFPKLRGQSREDIVYNLSNLADFLTARRGSLSGIHDTNKKIQQALSRKGVEVSDKQLAQFGNFMNAMKKALNIKRGEYASTQLASLYSELLERGKISKTAFTKKINEIMRDMEEERGERFTRTQRKRKNSLIKSGNWEQWFNQEEDD